LVVSWTHSAVSTGTVMALAMTRALSVAAPDIAWVNCLNIYFISGSLVTPIAGASASGIDVSFEPDPSPQVLARPEDGPGGWSRGPVALADVAESTGAADLHREREARYRRDRESWRARLR